MRIVFFSLFLSFSSCCCKFSTIILGCTFCFRHRVVWDESVSKSVQTHTGNDIPIQSYSYTYCVLYALEWCWNCCIGFESFALLLFASHTIFMLVVVCETFVGFDNVLPKYSWPQPTWEPKFYTKCQIENCRYQAQQENNSTHTYTHHIERNKKEGEKMGKREARQKRNFIGCI